MAYIYRFNNCGVVWVPLVTCENFRCNMKSVRATQALLESDENHWWYVRNVRITRVTRVSTEPHSVG